MEQQYSIDAVLDKYHSAPTYFGKLKALSEYYQIVQEDILALSRKSVRNWYTVYPIDWVKLFTPIEMDIWMSIRAKGVVLYPQYPVLNYHTDFGNPLLKIAVEVDGSQFHQDKQKDQYRDERMRQAGWTVYRITGKEAYRTNYMSKTDCSEERLSKDEAIGHLEHWLLNTGDGVIEAVKVVYFTDAPDDWYTDLCQQSLREHCLQNKAVHQW